MMRHARPNLEGEDAPVELQIRRLCYERKVVVRDTWDLQADEGIPNIFAR